MTLHQSHSYPIRGFFYLIQHRSIWRYIIRALIIMILVSIIISILLFLFVFPSQANGLSKYMANWISWIISFILTLFEIGIIILIFSSLYIAYYMDVIFDAVWRQETMIINQNETRERILSTSLSCIKSFLTLIIFRVFLVVLTSPLNIIPIFGTILYIYINGYYYAWSLHCRYFDLIGLTFAQGKHFVEQNRLDYTRFGIVAILFEMIPFLNIITPITNVIGSAIWASHIERFKQPLEHPRSYLLSPTPTLIKEEENDYRRKISEKEKVSSSNYKQVIENNIYPSAPPIEKE
ncbi:unnamed protein product [Rotaria sordida]|uniref:Uncharacterized protein n=1 Tax=Rotaria sordida TaxID=392033 RepID=A0A814S217_9BILA|nr:unnamed protein product [Rotaria sordida]CAF1140985.1 unnamed protein product [Rotaria sordida]CAF1255591.1 unnamed protein product [Rotaria sordida]CAF4115876.1 unnamed protein product [Rotaria sordida]